MLGVEPGVSKCIKKAVFHWLPSLRTFDSGLGDVYALNYLGIPLGTRRFCEQGVNGVANSVRTSARSELRLRFDELN